MLHLTSVGVRGQLVGIDSVLLLCGSWDLLRTPGLVQEAPSLISAILKAAPGLILFSQMFMWHS